jgi:hypothetical protein
VAKEPVIAENPARQNMEKAIRTVPTNTKGRLPKRLMRKMKEKTATDDFTAPNMPLARSFTD